VIEEPLHEVDPALAEVLEEHASVGGDGGVGERPEAADRLGQEVAPVRPQPPQIEHGLVDPRSTSRNLEKLGRAVLDGLERGAATDAGLDHTEGGGPFSRGRLRVGRVAIVHGDHRVPAAGSLQVDEVAQCELDQVHPVDERKVDLEPPDEAAKVVVGEELVARRLEDLGGLRDGDPQARRRVDADAERRRARTRKRPPGRDPDLGVRAGLQVPVEQPEEREVVSELPRLPRPGDFSRGWATGPLRGSSAGPERRPRAAGSCPPR
jgi:hypothetical protein